MDDYQSPRRAYNHNVGAVGVGEIEKWAILFKFLDCLGTDLNPIDDTVITTPELAYAIPTLQHGQVIGSHQDDPWNVNRVGGSPNAADKGCQSQWHLSWSIFRKIEEYRLALQDYDGLGQWLGVYKHSEDIINAGLRALGSILQRRVPDQFNDILCAMMVQHATHNFAYKRNLFKEVNESAFTTWGRMIPSITEADQEILDTVFQRLTSSDGSSPGDAPPSWPSDQTLSSSSLSGVAGVGSAFTNHTIPYPMAVDGNSLHDSSQHGHLDPNPILTSTTSFNHPTDSYLVPYQTNYIWNMGPFGPCYFDGASPYSITPLHQPPGFRGMYGSSRRSDYPQYGAQRSPGALHHSKPFLVFMEFMNGFVARGGLLELFSHRSNHESSSQPELNTRDSEARFLTKAETSFFHPLTRSISQSPPGPIPQAIVSTTWSLVHRGQLHSFQDTADFMVRLGKNLLPSSQSFASFAQAVLQTCSLASTGQLPRDQIQNIKRHVEETTREWGGRYHPDCLLRAQDLNSRGSQNLRPKIVSRASSHQPTLSNIESSGSVGRSQLDAPTEVSTAFTTNTTPSATSSVKCPSCEKTYSGKHAKSHLSRHKRDHRETNIPIKCDFCGKVFGHTRTDNIRTHYRQVHQQELQEDGRTYWAKKRTPSEP
ncbi:hypothetical protein F4818DRAFT_213574 [Hypoxylon cercidicola]|nr:hypothetical protein F4818DRAFT_213574 [Hypoxylon cercidicola]